MTRRRGSIRRNLLRNLVLLVLLASGAILGVTVLAGRSAVESLSQTLIDKAAQQTEIELDGFFRSVRTQVRVGRAWAERGMLDADDPRALNRLFVPILEQHPQISSMMVSEPDGTEYLLLRDALKPDQWMNRVTRVTPGGGRAHRRYWNTRTGTVREQTVPLDYDTRTRVWYRGGLKTRPEVAGQDIYWSPPVIFFTTKDPGITAASHGTHPDGRKLVVAFDLLLLDISRMTTRRIHPSDGGTAFVLVEHRDSGDLRVVGLPRDPRYADDQAIKDALSVVPQNQTDASARLPLARRFEGGPLAAAVTAWRAGGRRDGSAFRFEGPGGTWWAGLRSYPVGDNRFWIGVAVPEKDFLGEIRRQQVLVLGISLLALLAAIILAFVLARLYARPLEQLAETSRRIRALELDVDVDVTSRLREVNDLAESQRELLSAMQSFVRYVPLEVVRELVRRGDVARIGGTTANLTILFTDVRGFTTISEAMPPQQLAQHMAEYFDGMLAELNARGATVDKFVGDAIVAFWGAPTPDADHAAHAVESALACVERLEEMNARWEARGLPTMPTRFGLATGEVVVGNIGAASRLSYTVLGDKVNLAARLESANKRYGTTVMASAATREAAGPGFVWRRLDRVAVKGKSEAEDVYELLGAAGRIPPDRQAFAEAYEAALRPYQAGEFEAALVAARALAERYPEDPSVARLLSSCEQVREHPPTGPWDGATRLKQK